MNLNDIDKLLQQPVALRRHITDRLEEHSRLKSLFDLEDADWPTISAVLFAIGRYPVKGQFYGQPCLILNKRSAKVRQPGDLCCPGGRVSPRLDAVLATLLRLPMLPLANWPYWSRWQRERARRAGWLRLLLATGLRESLEEMRLNPFGVAVLGPLESQPLVMFGRVIYPIVVWVSGQKRFYPNWEVDKIVRIPLRNLFDSAKYARYRLRIENPASAEKINIFPCFRLKKDGTTEILWGATYRITIGFLKQVFGFEPPDMHSLPEIHGRLGRFYLSRAS